MGGGDPGCGADFQVMVMQARFVNCHSRRVFPGMATEFSDLLPLSDQLPNLMPHAIGFTPPRLCPYQELYTLQNHHVLSHSPLCLTVQFILSSSPTPTFFLKLEYSFFTMS